MLTGADPKSFAPYMGSFMQDNDHIYVGSTQLSVDKNSFEYLWWDFYKDDKKVYLGNDIVYRPSLGYDSNKDLINVDAKSFRRLDCVNGLQDQYWNFVEVYSDRDRLFIDVKGLGASILFAVGSGFDYESLSCIWDKIIDNNGLFATIDFIDWGKKVR